MDKRQSERQARIEKEVDYLWKSDSQSFKRKLVELPEDVRAMTSDDVLLVNSKLFENLEAYEQNTRERFRRYIERYYWQRGERSRKGWRTRREKQLQVSPVEPPEFELTAMLVDGEPVKVMTVKRDGQKLGAIAFSEATGEEYFKVMSPHGILVVLAPSDQIEEGRKIAERIWHGIEAPDGVRFNRDGKRWIRTVPSGVEVQWDD